MSNLTPLTSKSGQSEWPYEGKTLIAIEETDACHGCILIDTMCWRIPFAMCTRDFEYMAIYIEKPAEK